MNSRLPAFALTSAALLIALTGCAAETDAAPTAAPSPTESASESPSPEPAPVETGAADEEPAAEPTCETIIGPNTIAIFEEHDWTHEEQEFRIGADVVDGGIHCVWGDYTVASDHVQLFGWAPISHAESTSAQQKLLSDGWLRVDEEGHTFITEDPAFAIAVDESGYGMTYEFGDGWVTLADTKQSLVLIKQP